MAIIIGLGLSIIAIPMYYAFQKDPQWDNPGIETICTVYKMNGTSARYSVFIEYYVDGNRYTGSMKIRPSGLRPGEKFKMKYDKSYPERYQVFVDKPIFLTSERTLKTTGKVKKIQETGLKVPALVFEYSTGQSNKLVRSQRINPDFKNLFPDLKPGNVYEMEYWVNDPGRAVIYLDKRVE